MREPNIHGLTRDVPEPVRRAVRQDCGFACVACGSIGMHYDHFAPEFVECRAHDPLGIALLCPTCHQDHSSGRLPAERVGTLRAQARELWKDPAWRTQFFGGEVRLRLGTNVLRGPRVGLSFGPLDFFTIEANDDALESWALSGSLVDGAGALVRFERNEVKAMSSNWDVKLEGQLLTFQRRPGRIALQLRMGPNELAIERLALAWPSGVTLNIDAEGNIVLDNLRNTSNRNSGRLEFSGNTVLFDAAHPSPQSMVANIAGCFGGRFMLTIRNNRMLAHGGVADLTSLVNVSELLSLDMLATD